MIFRYLTTLVAGFIMFGIVTAQLPDGGNFTLTEALLESIASSYAEAGDYEAIITELESIQRHPFDLNRVQKEDLEKLPFLTEFQINSLLEYRHDKGGFISIYELQVVFGFNDDIIALMLPFIKVEEDPDIHIQGKQNGSGSSNHNLILRMQRVIEKSRGYSAYDSVSAKMKYPGTPWFYNLHYEYQYKDRIRAGFTVEKDPGEELFKASNRAGFDFNSGFLMISNTGILKSLVIGDYRLAFGQGLTLWHGTAPGKSSLPLNIVKRQDAAKPFTSNDENNYFRGFAANAVWRRVGVTAFFSSGKRDANITDTLESGHVYFSSFQENGNHRTLSEIADEKSVRETVLGANIRYRNNYMKIGTTLASYHLNKYLEPGSELKDIHDFSGNHLVNWGTDYTVTLDQIQLFGEFSNGNGHWAMLHGLLWRANKFVSLSALYRNLNPGYCSLHSSAFSEGSEDANENGYYIGIVLHPLSGLKFSGYADFYKFPWLRNNQSAPSGGRDYLLQADYGAGKKTAMYLRLKRESVPHDETSDGALIPELSEIVYTGVRYHISFPLYKRFMIQDRIEVRIADPASGSASRGIMIYHDFEYRLKHATFDLRIAWFHTDDYASRIYAYEQDMSAGFSFSPLSGKGIRSYLMARIDLTSRMSCAVRYSGTYYSDNQTIGSGYDEIKSNTRQDVKFRLAFRL